MKGYFESGHAMVIEETCTGTLSARPSLGTDTNVTSPPHLVHSNTLPCISAPNLPIVGIGALFIIRLARLFRLRESFRIFSIAKRSGRGPSPLYSNAAANHFKDSGISSGPALHMTTGKVGRSVFRTSAT